MLLIIEFHSTKYCTDNTTIHQVPQQQHHIGSQLSLQPNELPSHYESGTEAHSSANCSLHALEQGFETRTGPTVRPENPQTVHFYGSFSIKNRSIGKKQEPVRTAVGPLGSENRDQIASHGFLLPFESEP